MPRTKRGGGTHAYQIANLPDGGAKKGKVDKTQIGLPSEFR